MTIEEKRAIELAKLKKYCEKNGVPTHAETIKLQKQGIIKTATYFTYSFKTSWKEVLKLIGFEPVYKKKDSITDEEVLSILRKYFTENGVQSSVTYEKYRKENGLPSVNCIYTKFGGWNNVLKILGIKDDEKPKDIKLKLKDCKFTSKEYKVIEQAVELAGYKTLKKSLYEICKYYVENKEKIWRKLEKSDLIEIQNLYWIN